MRPQLPVVLALAFASGADAEPLTKAQLLDLVAKGVDQALVRALVERDCVAFDIDAATLIELSPAVPAKVLEAAIDCRKVRAGATGELPGTASNDGATTPALSLDEVRAVTVIPIVLDGVVDSGLTSKFEEELRQRTTTLKIQDALRLELHLEGTQSFDSRVPLLSILRAARAEGVDAFFLGTASSYTIMGAPGIRLDVKLIETRRGTVIWSAAGASKGGGFSEQHAKAMACRSALRQLAIRAN